MKYILLIAIFLLSLLNHTPYVYIPAVFLLVFYMASLHDVTKISNGEMIATLTYFLFILFSSIYFLTISIDVSDASRNSFTNNLLFSFILFIIVFSIYRICKSEKGMLDLKFSISFILILHVSIFMLQLVTVYVTGYYIDFVEPVTGEASRYINYILGGALSGVLKYRATGLYVEPSTYASAMTCVIASAVALNVNRKIINIAIITLLLNFSTIGIILFFFVSISIYFNKIKLIHASIAAIAIIVMGIIYSDTLFYFIDDFIYKVENTSGSRFKLLDYIYFDTHGNLNLFGSGFFNIPSELYAKITYGDYSVAALNDAGLFNFIYLKFGILSIIPICYLFYKINRVSSKLLFACILISKISFMFPVLYLALIPSLMVKKQKKAGDL